MSLYHPEKISGSFLVAKLAMYQVFLHYHVPIAHSVNILSTRTKIIHKQQVAEYAKQHHQHVI